jgi:hypothetical protein
MIGKSFQCSDFSIQDVNIQEPARGAAAKLATAP